ncbi:rho-related BTB domain-containing protein 3 isoform X2 [Hyperolius riggenbachi]|uniref:rho-related BTB domain-containing protein 3 isoform X2 n=1 Tax=Hyperolius riggenbachi TaxID=752182 RepID=UPI0035A29DBF
MSVGIVSLGKEDSRISDNEDPSSLVPFYLGRRAYKSRTEESSPGYKVYQGILLGRVQVVVYEYSDWDTFNNNSEGSQNNLDEADIVVIKFPVNDKASFLEIKDHFLPVIKQTFNHSFIPVIVLAIGARQNDGPLCTCPMCTSDREICVTTNEGLQLAKDIGATYLELHSLNDFYVVKYFGGVLEYFIFKTMNRKLAANGMKKKNQIKPPKLFQPEKMPVLKDEPSRYVSDMENLLLRCQCVDVMFYTAELQPVCGAHRVVLCSMSAVFMFLFGVTSSRDMYDSSIRSTARSLFSVHEESAIATHSSPIRVLVKDSSFHICLPEILNFIYTGASHWQLLEQQIKEKLKDNEKVELVYRLVQCIVKKSSQVRQSTDGSNIHSKQPMQLSESLGLFYNNPLLADVIFQIQDYRIPAHRAVLAARCDVMSAMFSGSYSEANQTVIPVQDVSKDTFLAFLEYIYRDSFCPVLSLRMPVQLAAVLHCCTLSHLQPEARLPGPLSRRIGVC